MRLIAKSLAWPIKIVLDGPSFKKCMSEWAWICITFSVYQMSSQNEALDTEETI